MQLLTLIRTTLHRWAVYDRTYGELSAFSERELADIGICRSEIRDIARDAAAKFRPETTPRGKSFTQVATAN